MNTKIMNTNDLLKSTLLGVIGGAAGLLAMRLYWKAATALAGEDPRTLTQEGPPDALDEIGVAGQLHEEDESSTAALGRLAYEAAADEAPDEETKARLSNAVHWGYGLSMGGVYGALRAHAGGLDAPGGLAFGTALWLLGDELMVSLLGLAKGPTAFPLEQHAHRFGAHVAYGLATSAATQALHGLTNGSPAGLAWRAAKTYLSWKAVKKAAQVAFR